MRAIYQNRNWFRLSSCILLALACLACEEPINLDFEIPKSRLVINSNFFPNETITLRVSATGSNEAEAVEVTDAEVSIFEGNELAEQLIYIPGSNGNRGSYRTQQFRPMVGQKYTLHVSATGFDPITAISSIPDPISITSVKVAGLTIDETDSELIFDYRLHVDYDDPVDQVNYYDLRISQLVTPYYLNEAGDTVRLLQTEKSVSLPARDSEGGNSVSLLLQDKPDSGPLHVALQSRIDPSRELIGDLVAELRTVSPEYYFYQRSLNKELFTPDGGLNEPVVIFNNVEKGLGIFAGYNSVQENLSLTTH